MNFEEVQQNLELFLDRKRAEEVKGKLERFKEDTWLTETIVSRFIGKEMRNLSADDFVQACQILENVVLIDYPVDNVVQYQPLYSVAINNNYLTRGYKPIISHLNNVSKIEKFAVSLGINKNPNFDQRTRDANDRRIHLFENSSYLGFMHSLLSEDPHTRDSMIGLEERLKNFETHLQDLKEQEINLAMLLSFGYSDIIKNLDLTQNRKEVNKFPEAAKKITEILKQLDSLGFDLYQKLTVSKLGEWVSGNKLDVITLLTNNLSREAFMYVSGLHLKK